MVLKTILSLFLLLTIKYFLVFYLLRVEPAPLKIFFSSSVHLKRHDCRTVLSGRSIWRTVCWAGPRPSYSAQPAWRTHSTWTGPAGFLIVPYQATSMGDKISLLSFYLLTNHLHMWPLEKRAKTSPYPLISV